MLFPFSFIALRASARSISSSRRSNNSRSSMGTTAATGFFLRCTIMRSPPYSARLTRSENWALAVLVVSLFDMYHLYNSHNSLSRKNRSKAQPLTDHLFKLQRVWRYWSRRRLERAQLLVGVADPVDDGNRAQHRDDPKHRTHPVEQRADNDEHDPFRALHESHLATWDKRFGARARVAHHHRAGHDEGRQDHVEEAVGAGVIHQQPKEQHHIAVAVDDGIEEAAERRDLVGGAGDAAVHHVKNAGADDHQTGIKKHPALVFRVRVAEQNAGHYVDAQPDEGERVGRDAGERQAVDNLVQQPLARLSDCARPRHKKRLCLVVNRDQLQHLELALACGSDHFTDVSHLLAHQRAADW